MYEGFGFVATGEFVNDETVLLERMEIILVENKLMVVLDVRSRQP